MRALDDNVPLVSANMAVKPEQLAERLELIAYTPQSAAANELRKLVQETKAIVQADMPDLKLDLRWPPQPPLPFRADGRGLGRGRKRGLSWSDRAKNRS